MRFSWRALAHPRRASADASDKMLNLLFEKSSLSACPPVKSMRPCHHRTQTLYYHRLGKVHVKQGVVVGVIAAIPAVPAAFIAQRGASAPSPNNQHRAPVPSPAVTHGIVRRAALSITGNWRHTCVRPAVLPDLQHVLQNLSGFGLGELSAEFDLE